MPLKNKKGPYSKLITDKNTDYIFEYYINEEKFNEQQKGEWDAEMQQKIMNHQAKLGYGGTEKNTRSEKPNNPRDKMENSEQKELPSTNISDSGILGDQSCVLPFNQPCRCFTVPQCDVSILKCFNCRFIVP